MGILEDVMKALERIPAWKRLISAVPAEMEALTQRVAAIEARLAAATDDVCPRCRAVAFALIESRPEQGSFGALGVREYVWRCSSCRYEDVRQTPPGP